MIRKYQSNESLIENYVENYIIDKSRIYHEYREDVYKDFIKNNPDCNISSHYFTRHINRICGTTLKLVCENGRLVYIFVKKEEE